MAMAQTQMGGRRPTFARHVGDGLVDLRGLALGIRGDVQMLELRIEQLQDVVASHEEAISGVPTTQCRRYRRCDPTCDELRRKTRTPAADTTGA